jgi:acyl-CoA synthetase (NDP forming)
MELTPVPSLAEVFSPRSVALVGVSGSGKIGFAEMILMGHIEMGTPQLYPVNPKYKEVLGLSCFATLLDIPGPVDHVIVNIPADLVLGILDQCAKKGVKSVHLYTAGFGESGNRMRADLETKILEAGRHGNFRIFGPNCVGLFIPKAKTTYIMGVPFDHGPIGFISQSGGHASNIINFSARRGLRFSKVVSYGNALDVNEIELLHYLAGDPETEIIGVYIEGLKNGQVFYDALKTAATLKPVVVYKGGKTSAGLRAAHGHTASMVSSVEIFEAVCKQANAIQVDNLDEMQDAMVALRFLKTIPAGKNIALFGSGGGPSVMAGDEMETVGMRIPQFSGTTQSRLKSVLPVDGGIFSNPLDTTNLIDPKAIEAALDILGDLPDVDMLVYHMGFHPIGGWGFGRFSQATYLAEIIDVMMRARQKTEKAVLIALRPPQDITPMQEFLAVQQVFVEHGFPVFHSLGQLALTMNRLVTWKNRSFIPK